MDEKKLNINREEIIVEPLIFELGSPGRTGISLPDVDVPCREVESLIPRALLRQDNLGDMPELSQLEVVRHFTKLSQMNYGVDQGFYPLGSCTMKYNPKVNEDVAKMAGFAKTHPYQGDDMTQGLLQILWQLERYLAEIGGIDHVSLHPAAGAQGELTGLLIIRAFHEAGGQKRWKILLPDSAHGTNPASSSLTGYDVVEVHSDSRGCLTPKSVAEVMDEKVAGLMITLPNTLGLFEEDIGKIIEIVHKKGGLVYCDGANLNAMLGLIRPGDLGVDILHYNLHKTFSTPHGGGGPGAGPIGVKKELAPFLPTPVIERYHDRDGFFLNYNRPKSVGKVRAFLGNVGILIRAYVYIRALGPAGLKRIAEMAIINANYLKEKLKKDYYLPFDKPCLHEFVLSHKWQEPFGVQTRDIAKRLIDYGFHPPTINFPLIVKGALMIEPTESENVEGLNRFIKAMEMIALEAHENPGALLDAPHSTPVGRLDEVRAIRELNLRWRGKEGKKMKNEK